MGVEWNTTSPVSSYLFERIAHIGVFIVECIHATGRDGGWGFWLEPALDWAKKIEATSRKKNIVMKTLDSGCVE